MCGPADFDALHTCIVRLAELSAAGLTTCSVYKTISLCRELCAVRGKRKGRMPWGVHGQVAAEGSRGQPDA